MQLYEYWSRDACCQLNEIEIWSAVNLSAYWKVHCAVGYGSPTSRNVSGVRKPMIIGITFLRITTIHAPYNQRDIIRSAFTASPAPSVLITQFSKFWRQRPTETTAAGEHLSFMQMFPSGNGVTVGCRRFERVNEARSWVAHWTKNAAESWPSELRAVRERPEKAKHPPSVTSSFDWRIRSFNQQMSVAFQSELSEAWEP